MKVLKYGLLLLVLLQMPFLYRVCQTRQLRSYLESLPEPSPHPTPFRDLRGTVHVHSAAGSHSLGTYRDIARAALEAGYDYVFITDHPREYVLFNPLEDPGLVMVYGVEEERDDGGRILRSPDSRVRVLSTFEGDSVPSDVTGLEIFNIADSARRHNNVFGWLTWLYHAPTPLADLFFFHAWEFDPIRLDLWDRESASRRLPAVAGNNAHQNVGLVVISGTGRRLLSLFIDPYVRSFRFVANHLQVPWDRDPSEDSVLDALAGGASYIAFERIADPTGFSFHAASGGTAFPMGSEVPLGSQLVFQSPLPARFRLLRSGDLELELEGLRFAFDTEIPGTYRVEVYLLNPPRLLRDKPWIISNPIYVR
jgi:hypothetical protein